MTCKDKVESYPGFTCTGDDSYKGCLHHFGRIESFDNHFILIDPNQPMWPPDDWTDEEAKAHEMQWPSGNMRCATVEEIKAMGLRQDHNLVWRTKEEEEIARRLQDGLGKLKINFDEDHVLED